MTITGAGRSLLDEFAYVSNRIKLEYLEACCRSAIDAEVAAELEGLYRRPVMVMGGMNEAFRFALGRPDIETSAYLASGEPWVNDLLPRRATRNLLADADPRLESSSRDLDRICADLVALVSAMDDLVAEASIVSDFLLLKITAHDLLIHGRGEMPAHALLSAPFARVERAEELRYAEQVSSAPPDAFRVENLVAYTLASGADPVAPLVGTPWALWPDRDRFRQELRAVWDRLPEVDLASLFRWDVYGMCAFPEGPVFYPKHTSGRYAEALAVAWEGYPWGSSATATDASARIFGEVFHLVLDTTTAVEDTTAAHFSEPLVRRRYLSIAAHARDGLERHWAAR